MDYFKAGLRVEGDHLPSKTRLNPLHNKGFTASKLSVFIIIYRCACLLIDVYLGSELSLRSRTKSLNQMAEIRRGDRVIHLNGGTYNERIDGNYVQGKSDTAKPTERNITSESEVIDAKPKN